MKRQKLENNDASSSEEKQVDLAPSNAYVTPMLTDLYQISMSYAYWCTGHHERSSTFDLFFRKNPFKGEFTIFAGLEECLRFVASFRFTEDDISQLRARFPEWKSGFFDWLGQIDCSEVKLYAIEEGTVVFPRVPLIRVEGPLAVCQLLETTLLTCVNYPSLIATNAARHRIAAGPGKTLLEFGLRRAQGPDGGISASRYSVMGGFNGTSNVKAAVMFNLTCKGTHAHSFVTSYVGTADLNDRTLQSKDGSSTVDFVDLVETKLKDLGRHGSTNQGEMAAFIAYAQAYPSGFLALIDTYDTLNSGLYNFLAVSLALEDLGYKSIGIRLDSGDLAYLSRECRRVFVAVGKEQGKPNFAKFNIVASNDLSEDVLYSLNDQGHEIDSFGIGTNLVTCQKQPALGCVYKLVEIDGKPRIKLSQDVEKVTIPGKKDAYRLYSSNGEPLMDLLCHKGTPAPNGGERILCHHPFDSNKRVYVTPTTVKPLLACVFDGVLKIQFDPVEVVRKRVIAGIEQLRSDHLRILNPTPYKISVSGDLFNFMHKLWQSEAPIRELS